MTGLSVDGATVHNATLGHNSSVTGVFLVRGYEQIPRNFLSTLAAILCARSERLWKLAILSPHSRVTQGISTKSEAVNFN
jgi:hypothetical protein